MPAWPSQASRPNKGAGSRGIVFRTGVHGGPQAILNFMGLTGSLGAYEEITVNSLQENSHTVQHTLSGDSIPELTSGFAAPID